MSAQHRLVLGNNQFETFIGPDPGIGGFYQIDFTATDPSHPGTVALGEPPGAPLAGGHGLWRFQSLVADGTPGHKVYGSVNFEAPYSGTATFHEGMNLSYGNVSLVDYDGSSFALTGVNTVTNDSALTAWGGRYATIGLGDTFHLNGVPSVTNHSVANFDNANLAGTGTISVSSGSIVDASTIIKGLHIDVDRGGTLALLYPNSAATIIEAAGGKVFVGGAATATREIFREASGTLDLLNKSGVQVASLKFAPGSHEYTSTAPIHGGFLEITTNPMMAGNLHTTFTSYFPAQKSSVGSSGRLTRR